MIWLTLFLEFFKIGLFCFGGAFGMIPLIEETVLKHGWLTQSQFIDLIGVCESTPGPIAVNMATYIGSTQGGPLGSVCATLGVVMPSFLIILLIASVMKNLGENRFFKGFIRGVQPVVAALILSTGVILLTGVLGRTESGFRFELISAVILALLAGAYFLHGKLAKKRMSSIALIILSAVLGIGVCLLAERLGWS